MSSTTGQITIDQLRTLVQVAEARSYLIDATHSRSGATSVRMTLKRLAAATGDPNTPLAVSIGRGQVTLTDRGEQVVHYARSAIGMIDALPKLDHPVKVAVYGSLMLRMLRSAPDPDALPFEFVPADSARADGGRQLTRLLDHHEIDIAVAPSGLAGPRQQERWLYSWELRAVGRLPNAELSTVAKLCHTERTEDERDAISLRNLAKHPLLVSPPGYHSRSVLLSAAERAGLSLRVRFELADQGLMQQLANLTDWIAVMPSDAYGVSDAGGGAAVVANGEMLDGSYSAYYREDLGKVQTERERRTANAISTIVELFQPGSGAPRRQPKARRSTHQ